MDTAGWLKRQFERVEKDIRTWPDWMKRGSGLEDWTELSSQQGVERKRPVYSKKKGDARGRRSE